MSTLNFGGKSKEEKDRAGNEVPQSPGEVAVVHREN